MQFTDVGFVERRDASRLVPSEDWEGIQKRTVVQAVYESLLLKRLGVRSFRDTKGTRVDVKALRSGELDRSDIDDLLSRAFAIATRKGQAQGDIVAGGADATAAGRALSALRLGADPKLVKRQMKAAGMSDAAMERVLRLSKGRVPSDTQERLADYEETLALRRKPVASRPATKGTKTRPPPRRKNVAQGNRPPTTYASGYGPPEKTLAYDVRIFASKTTPVFSDTLNSGAVHAVLGGLGSSNAQIARQIEEADRTGKSRRTQQGFLVEVKARVVAEPTAKFPLRRNYIGAAVRGISAMRGMLGSAAVFLTRYGQAASTATRSFVKTPIGAQLSAAIVIFGANVLGKRVVESGVFGKKDIEKVQHAIESETGAALSQEVIAAALEGAAKA